MDAVWSKCYIAIAIYSFQFLARGTKFLLLSIIICIVLYCLIAICEYMHAWVLRTLIILLFNCVPFVVVHKEGFILFVIFSSLHMLLTCHLFKKGHPLPWSHRVGVYDFTMHLLQGWNQVKGAYPVDHWPIRFIPSAKIT